MKIQIDMSDFYRKWQIAMTEAALDIENSLKDKLTKEHGVDTQNLKGSIKVRYNSSSGNIEIEMADYGLYLEYGTPPHKSPVEKIDGKLRIPAYEGWVRRKWGMGSKDGDKENIQGTWILAKIIKMRGTRPYPFIRPTFENEVMDIIKAALKRNFK